MPLSETFTKRLAARTAEIYRDWPRFRQLAADGYRADGRGAFFVDLSKPYDPSAALRYANVEGTKSILSDPLSVIIRIEGYDPEHEIVFAFLAPDLREGQCVVLQDRPSDDSLPPIVADLPDPRTARSFEELTDILNDIYSRRDIEGLQGDARDVWRILQAQGQILSNGFGGYFWNVGTEVFEAHAAFRNVGAGDFVRVFDEAFAKFPDGKPSQDEERFFEQLDAIGGEEGEEDGAEEEDPWGEQDDDFYAIEETLPAVLWNYWQKSMARMPERP